MPDTTADRLGRNDPCHCGSGKKYKRCCLGKDEAAEHQARIDAAAEAAARAAAAPPEEHSAPDAPQHRRPTDQPWKRGVNDYRPFQRFMTPRKRGGG